jgi:hypothetical protein
MTVVWTACRVVAVTLLAVVLAGWAFDWTAADLADGVVFLLVVAFLFVSVVSASLLGWVLVELWRESRDEVDR